MAKKRLSRDQKRKAKLTERSRKHPPRQDLVYTGNRYKTPELTPVVHATESAIFLAHLASGRQLTDRLVFHALENMVLLMRGPGLPDFDPEVELKYEPGRENELVMQSIRGEWHDLFQGFPHPGTETLIGILRTLLSSIDTWGTRSPDSRGYLNFIEGFLGKVGVRLTPEMAAQMSKEDFAEEPDDLLELGEEWVEGNPDVRSTFYAEAERLLEAGQGNHVAEVAQRLLGRMVTGGPLAAELSALSLRAQGYKPRLP